MCSIHKNTRPNTIRLFPVGCSKECCLHRKIMYTARPEAWHCNWMCRCSISNNTERLPICCTPSSTVHCCWWWTFWTSVTLNLKISQFYLFICESWTFNAWIYFVGHSVYILILRSNFLCRQLLFGLRPRTAIQSFFGRKSEENCIFCWNKYRRAFKFHFRVVHVLNYFSLLSELE
jgi:hypothetical protein